MASLTPVEVISPLPSEEFFHRYIETRTPVIIRGYDPQFRIDPDILDKPIPVSIEHSHGGDFGHGYKSQTTLSQFLAAKDPTTYLSTQYESESSDSPGSRLRSYAQPPLSELLGSVPFPLRPALFPSLVPQQVNLWIGFGGGSSGLHHDHAENAYIVFRGRKRFVLFPPETHPLLYLHGKVREVGKNGLVKYEKCRDDGASWADVGSWRLAKAEAGLAEAEAAGAETEEWERQLDEALEMLSRGEEEGEEGEEEDEEEKEEEEEQEREETSKEYEDSENISEKETQTEMETETEVGDAEKNTDRIASPSDPSGRKRRLSSPTPAKRARRDPPSFSKIPPHLVHYKLEGTSGSNSDEEKLIKEQFPLFLKAQGKVAELQEGDVLYLPVGWFHEVTSYPEDGIHIAFNYWMFPPTERSYSQPYPDEFWAEQWEEVRKEVVEARGESKDTCSF